MHEIQLKDVVRLLIGERDERFPYERAICLFKFQLWVLFPDHEFTHLASLTAATKILDRIQDHEFVEQEEPVERSQSPWLRAPVMINLNDRPSLTVDRICDFRNNEAFFGIFNTFIAASGGLDALLHALPPSQLDKAIRKRSENCAVVTSLVDYRLRYAQHAGTSGGASTVRHAKFFNWYPTRKIRGGRGVTAAGKSVTPKTMDKWLAIWADSQCFLYVRNKLGLKQFPPEVDDGMFTEHLIKSANDTEGLKQFFGAAAFVQERLNSCAHLVPTSLPRIEVTVDPFNDDERVVIEAYEDNNFLLEEYVREDDG